MGFLKFPCFCILSDCEDVLSGAVYVMERVRNVHIYITILWQFECWKNCFQSYMRVKIAKFSEVAPLSPSQTSQLFLERTTFVRWRLTSSLFSQYAMFSQSSINVDFFYYLDRPWLALHIWNYVPATENRIVFSNIQKVSSWYVWT